MTTEEIRDLSDETEENCLAVNIASYISISQYSLFTNNFYISSETLQISGQVLPHCPSIKFLWVVIDDKSFGICYLFQLSISSQLRSLNAS